MKWNIREGAPMLFCQYVARTQLPSPYRDKSLAACNVVGCHVYANVRCKFNCLPSDRVLRSNSVLEVTALNTIPLFMDQNIPFTIQLKHLAVINKTNYNYYLRKYRKFKDNVICGALRFLLELEAEE